MLDDDEDGWGEFRDDDSWGAPMGDLLHVLLRFKKWVGPVADELSRCMRSDGITVRVVRLPDKISEDSDSPSAEERYYLEKTIPESLPNTRRFYYKMIERSFPGVFWHVFMENVRHRKRKKRGRKPAAKKELVVATAAELRNQGHNWEEISKFAKDQHGVSFSPETLRTYVSRSRNRKKTATNAPSV